MPTLVANTSVKKSLLSDVRTRKTKFDANSVSSKHLKFASRCLEISLAHYIKCTHRELRSVFGLLKNVSWCAKVLKNSIYFRNMSFPLTFIKVTNTNSKEKGLLMNQDRGKS